MATCRTDITNKYELCINNSYIDNDTYYDITNNYIHYNNNYEWPPAQIQYSMLSYDSLCYSVVLHIINIQCYFILHDIRYSDYHVMNNNDTNNNYQCQYYQHYQYKYSDDDNNGVFTEGPHNSFQQHKNKNKHRFKQKGYKFSTACRILCARTLK